MRIKTIRLGPKYKRFYDLTIDLGAEPKKIIALVGPNGSGKSSVFDGMLFLMNDYATIGSTGQKNIAYHSMDCTQVTNNSIQILFTSGETFIEVYNRKQPIGEGKTIFNFRNSYRYNANLNITNLQTIPNIRENRSGASNAADLDDKMTDNYQRLYIYLTDYRKANKLNDDQANEQVIGKLNAILKEALDLTITDMGDIISGKGQLWFTKSNQLIPFNFNVLSSGEKEVVDIIFDLFLKVSEYTETIYMIDEPELHLNTGIQKKLLVEIEKLIPDNCQLWVATHSIGFLSALQKELKEEAEIINFDQDLSTAVHVLRPMEKTRSNWQKIFRTALEDLTGLIAPSLIVYCEGRKEPSPAGDDQGLDAEVYNEIFYSAYPDTLFISSGGSTEPQQYAAVALTILNKAFKDVNIVLLKDKDNNHDGTDVTDEQRLIWLAKDPKKRRMLNRREIENYLFDMETLSRFASFDKATYDRIIPNINADIKNKAAELLKLCGITTGVSIDTFKRKLAKCIVPGSAVYNELESCIFESDTERQRKIA